MTADNTPQSHPPAPASPADADTLPLPRESLRPWRACVLATVRQWRTSSFRRRPLSLPNLCRLFELRWRSWCTTHEVAPDACHRGTALGRDFLHELMTRQPRRRQSRNGAPTT